MADTHPPRMSVMMDGSDVEALDMLLGQGVGGGGGDVDSFDDLFSLLPGDDDLSPSPSELEGAAGAAPLDAEPAQGQPPEAQKRAAAKRARSEPAEEEDDEEAVKRRRRLEKNRQSAQLSRERKRNQVDRLQAQVAQLKHDNMSLAYTLSVYHAEMQRMQEQLSKLTDDRTRALPAAASTADGPTADQHTDQPTTTHVRGHKEEDKPAVQEKMPSLLLLVAISTLLQAASCYLAGSLCLNTREALDRVRAYRTSCAEQARKGLPNWRMADAPFGADLTLSDGTVDNAG